MAARFAGFVLAASLLAGTAVWAADDDGYEWSTGGEDGYAFLVYGSPETDEDYGFLVRCDGNNKATGMTVYVDIAGARSGIPRLSPSAAARLNSRFRAKSQPTR